MSKISPLSIKLFLCYAREDEKLCRDLETHLSALKREGLIEIWSDRQIHAGLEWESEIAQRLTTAQIILLLVSPDFIASDYCYGTEMRRAMERHQQGTVRVIPIILRPTWWEKMPFGTLQALPTGAEPVMSGKWHHPDEAFKNIADEIYRVINDFFGIASPNIQIPPVIVLDWQQQLTSSPEWQYLSERASEALLRGWRQFAPQDRTFLFQGWQQLSPQDRMDLLKQWQQQYQELEKELTDESSNNHVDIQIAKQIKTVLEEIGGPLQPIALPNESRSGCGVIAAPLIILVIIIIVLCQIIRFSDTILVAK